MPTEAKKAWIKAMAEAGVRHIEVGSFVSPKAVPSMADTGEICRYAVTLPGLRVTTLVPNLKGAQFAAEAGTHAVSMPISVSRSHCLTNIRMTPEEAVGKVASVVAFRDGLPEDQRFRVEALVAVAAASAAVAAVVWSLAR